jgi:pseudaminic acid synthase
MPIRGTAGHQTNREEVSDDAVRLGISTESCDHLGIAMLGSIRIAARKIGPGQPTYVTAEVSANHNHDYDQAVRIIDAAKDAGADAIKLQTYTADTITIASHREEFRISGGTLWDGRDLHDLYAEAYTPWEWQPKLKKVAEDLGMDLFSSAFDATAVDFLEEMGVPAHKVASCELVDIPLIQKMARTGKPLIISTGMASAEEIEEALRTAREAGATQIALLKCNSAYPAPAEEMNLRTIPEMARRFGVPVGLSDHTMGIAAPVAAVALGACIIEKHLTLSRATPSLDSGFSLEPHEFKAMVEAVRTAEKALGEVHFGMSDKEEASRVFRRSLFVVQDVKRGETFTPVNIRSIRPGHGLHTRHLGDVLGKRARRDIERGTPMSWDLVVNSPEG